MSSCPRCSTCRSRSIGSRSKPMASVCACRTPCFVSRASRCRLPAASRARMMSSSSTGTSAPRASKWSAGSTGCASRRCRGATLRRGDGRCAGELPCAPGMSMCSATGWSPSSAPWPSATASSRQRSPTRACAASRCRLRGRDGESARRQGPRRRAGPAGRGGDRLSFEGLAPRIGNDGPQRRIRGERNTGVAAGLRSGQCAAPGARRPHRRRAARCRAC